MSLSQSHSERLTELDGVRGLAIALTLVSNTVLLGWGPGFGEKLWYHVAGAGWIGVQLFFVLSGFLITGILVDTKGDQAYFKNFYARRALRILPAYYLALLVAMFGLWLIGEGTPDHPLCYWLFIANFCIANAGRWSAYHFGVTWSLAVEEHFYLVWPLVAAFLSTRRLALVAAAILFLSLLLRFCLIAQGSSYLVHYTITPTRVDGLAMGALIAIAIRSQIGAEFLAKIAKSMLAVGLIAMIATAAAERSFDYANSVVAALGYPAVTLAGGGLVLCLVALRDTGGILRCSMRWAPLVSLGFYSYAIYLYHPIVYFIAAHVPPLRPEIWSDVPGGQVLAQFLFTGVVAIGTLALAVPSYHLFEKRFLDLRSYFPRRPTKLAPTPPLAARP